MEYLENLVFEYMKARPNRFISAKEVGRDVMDKKTYRENPWVAKKPLSDLADRGLLKTNEMGTSAMCHVRSRQGLLAP